MILKISFLSVVLIFFACFGEKVLSVDVFLGGSCNPTTWRKEIAIPKLNSMKITYYNPQVDNWSPALVEKENDAKRNAKVLLFVIDKKTRNTASMMEVIELAVKRPKSLVVVFTGFYNFNDHLTEKLISLEEFYSLNNALLLLRNVLNNAKVIIFDNLTTALDNMSLILKSKYRISTRNINNETPLKAFSVPNANRYLLVKLFKSVSVGRITSNDLKSIRHQKCQNNIKNAIKLNKVSLDQFISSTINKMKESKISESTLMTECLLGSKFLIEEEKKPSDPSKKINLYAGVGISDLSLATKYFGKLNNIQLQNIEDFNLDNFKNEMPIIRNSKVVLISISKNSWGSGPSQLAAYLIALGNKKQKLILNIEVLDDTSFIANSGKLDNEIIKDYNRGRTYLIDVAKRNHITIFANTTMAFEYCKDFMKSIKHI